MRKITRKFWLLSLCTILICAILTAVGCGGDDNPKNPSDPVQYTVTFDLCTELQTTKILPKTVESGSRIDEPQVFVTGDNSDNWEIDGWYREKTYESKWDFYFDEVDSNITLYAKWKSDPQYTVQFFAGDAAEPTYSTKVKKGLQAAECDDRFNGYEVLGYYTASDFKTEFDFTAPINAATNIYVKLSDYLYFTPKYLSTFTGYNATAELAADEKSIEVSYSLKDNYIHKKGLSFAMNGHELIEIVYKLEGAARVDIYWFASHSDGTPVRGMTDYNTETRNIGLSSHYTTITTAEDGWTHVVYDLTKPRAFVDGKLSAPLTDIAVLNGFRIEVDGETTDPAKLTIQSVKAQKKSVSEGYTVRYHADGREAYSEEVSAGQTATAPRDEQILVGRQILGYYTTEDYKTEFNFETPINSETDIYVKLSEYLYLNGAMLNEFNTVADAAKTLNADGTLTMSGPDGAFIHKKGPALALNGTNCIEIRAKVNIPNAGRVDIYVFGEYSLDGTPGESTDYGQANTRYRGMTTQGWTISEPDDEGYVIMTFDLAYTENGRPAKNFSYNVVKGFRIDIVGGTAEDNELVIDYVKSVRRSA